MISSKTIVKIGEFFVIAKTKICFEIHLKALVTFAQTPHTKRTALSYFQVSVLILLCVRELNDMVTR